MNFSIVADDLDSLVIQGIEHIKTYGERVNVTAGSALQAYGVNYILLDSRRRIHNLRCPISLRCLCRELMAYFKGSLDVDEGLSKASSVWRQIADESGKIHSNYGYYVFHQRNNDQTQYEWVIENLKRNLYSRKALININQLTHKYSANKDFPCAISAQFFVREKTLCCEVSSRSTDVVIGLPYDMGFFSFLNELVYQDLIKGNNDNSQLKLGYTMIKCSFTQIYDKTASKAEEALERSRNGNYPSILMPPIDNAMETLADIYNGTKETRLMEWIFTNADL
jgi:thymidylate synthase